MALNDDKKRPELSTVWREASELIRSHRRRLALGLLVMVVNRLSGLVLPAVPKYLIDDVINGRHADWLVPLALLAGAATLVQAGSSFALSQVVGVAAQRAITDMRKSVLEHISWLPIRFFDSTQTGILISRVMTDAEGIRNLVGNGLVQLVGGLITAALALGVLFYLNVELTLLTLLILGGFGAGMALAFMRLRPLFRLRGKINAEVTGRLGESLSGVRVVKAYRAERREQLVFAQGAHRLFRNVAQTITGVSAISAFGTLVLGAIGTVLILVGGRAILAGNMKVGDFMSYVLFTGLLVAPVIQIASISTQISEAFAGLDRIREIKRMAVEDAADNARLPLSAVQGEIACEDLCFEYNPEAPVLNQVSFVARPGTTTALVGSSGSGKSTLLSLLLAFHRPTRGRITLDGRDLKELRLRDYRAHLGVVLQDDFLFDGTLAENISFARPHATLDQIRAASRIAHCAEFIENLEKKYDTVVGERGVRLSGGQRQRVSIARAILADPKILALDEATSSLDSESEALIQDGLRALRRGRTTFVIAHRLSTIQSAEQILVLEHGQVVERGTHGELLEKNGRYRQLHDKQYKLERNRFINPGEDFTPPPPSAEPAPPANGVNNGPFQAPATF